MTPRQPPLERRCRPGFRRGHLARISHHLTTEARDRPAITSLRLLAVLNVLSSTPAFVKRRAPRPDGPLTHFASPRGEKSGLVLRLYRLGIVKLTRGGPGEDDLEMKPANPRYGYRYPGEVIAHASGLRTKPVRLSPLDLSVAGPTS